MVVFPNCKINLGLWVTEKLPDGYHAIETIFYPVPVFDILEIIPASDGKTEIIGSGIELPGEKENNICFKAWNYLDDAYPIGPVKIFLHKQIPTGAGLGGGSSDGAFTLRALNNIYKLGLDPVTLKQFAFRLGMDCPFFIRNEPAYATGKGEILSPVGFSLTGMYLSLVKPPVHVSTAEAYAGINPRKRNYPITDLLSSVVEEWRDKLTNDFEPSVFEKYPLIEKIKKTFYEKGAVYSSMSGSGSTVFGLFREKPEWGNVFPDCYQRTIAL
jgi:4-diphosphocytidyl-2-C-methyl-D-erythritol kinase